MLDITKILVKPYVTEKVSMYNEVQRDRKEQKDLEHKEVYVFVVDKKANRIQIKQAVEEMYGVQVEGVRTSIYKGKPKNRYTKSQVVSGQTTTEKRAHVTLAEGDFIDFYSN